MVVPQNRWFIMANPIKIDDFMGYPHFRKPPYNFHTNLNRKQKKKHASMGQKGMKRWKDCVSRDCGFLQVCS